jgi:hypothetical protein
MYRFQFKCFTRVVLGATLFSSLGAFALEFEPGVGAGLEYTDNAALTPDNEDSDLIAIGYLGARIEDDSGPLHGRATTSLSYNHYTENTFSDKYYFNLGANAGWRMIENRLEWQLQNYFTQQSINSLDANTPNNTQNTNAFSFGPNIYFPLSGPHAFTLRPLYRDFYYENSDTDNQQYALQAAWTYKMYRTLDVGLVGEVARVKYDDDQLYPNYTSKTLHLALSGRRVNSEYTLNLGATSIDRERSDNFEGFTGNLTWLINLTGRSSIRARVVSELTDTSTNLLNASARPENGDFSNEQISGDVLRNNTIRVAYAREGSTLNSDIWAEMRKLDYKESNQDRDTQTFGIDLDYKISKLLSSGIYGRYDRVKETDVDRTDKRYKVGGTLSYQLSRKLRSVLDLRYWKKDSTVATEEYTEVSALVSLVYGFGQVSRARRGGGGY